MAEPHDPQVEGVPSLHLPPQSPDVVLTSRSTQMSQVYPPQKRGRGVKVSRWPCVEPLYGETYLGAQRHLRHMVDHYKRIDNVVSLTDNSTPRAHENVRVKLKRLMLEGERLARQESLNKKMMNEILRVMKGPGMVIHYHDRPMKSKDNSLNFVERRMTINRINMENKCMLKRILETETCYDHIRMEIEYQRRIKQMLPKSLVFALWKKYRKHRRRCILHGKVQVREVLEPDEVRERFLTAHRRCFPSWPKPVRPRPLPRSSSPQPDQRPVDHKRCFVTPLLIPPLRHHRPGAVRLHHEGVVVTIPENKAQLLRSQCIHEKIEAMKLKPFSGRSTRAPNGVKFKEQKQAAGDTARKNENQSNVELPPIALSSAGSVSAKSRSSRSPAKSPDMLVPLSATSRSPGSPDAEDERTMKEMDVPGVQASTEEASPEQRSTPPININNSKSGVSPCISSLNQAFSGQRLLNPCAEHLAVKFPSVVEGKAKQALSKRPQKALTPIVPVRLPPVRIPRADKGTTSPSSAGSCIKASIPRKLRALVPNKNRDQKKKSDASPMDLLEADAADLPGTRHPKTKRRKGSVRSKSDLSVQEGAVTAITRQQTRSRSRKNGLASSSTTLTKSRVPDERLSRSAQHYGRKKSAEHSPLPQSHKVQAVHLQNNSAPMTEEVTFLSKQSKQKSSGSRKSRQRRPKASESVPRKSSKKDQINSTVASDKANPERLIRTPSTGHQQSDSHHSVDKRHNDSRNRDRSKYKNKEKNLNPESATTTCQKIKTKPSVGSHPADRSNNMSSLSEKSSQPKEILISPPPKRRNTKKSTSTASHPVNGSEHPCEVFDYHDEPSPATYNSNNNTSTGGLPSKRNSDNADCSAVASSSRSTSPESVPSSPPAGQKLGAAAPQSSLDYGTSVDHVSHTQACSFKAFGTSVDSTPIPDYVKTHKSQLELTSPTEKASERAAQAENDDPLVGVDFLSTGDFRGKRESPCNLRQETGRALDDFEADPAKSAPALIVSDKSNSGDRNFSSGGNGDVASPDLEPQLPTPKRKHGLLRFSPMRAQVLRSFAESIEEGDRPESQYAPTAATNEQVHQKAPDEEVEEEEGLNQGEDDEKDEIDEEIKTSRDFEDVSAELEEDAPTAAGTNNNTGMQSRSQTADTSFELSFKGEQETDDLTCSSSSSISDVHCLTEKPPGSAQEGESDSEEENAMYVSLNANGDSCDESASSLSDGDSSSDDEQTVPRKCSRSTSNTSLPRSTAQDNESLQSHSSATASETSLSADSPRLPRSGDGNMTENWNVNGDTEVARGDKASSNNDMRPLENEKIDIAQISDRAVSRSDQRPLEDDKVDVAQTGAAIIPSLPQQDQPLEVVGDQAASELLSGAEASATNESLNPEQGAVATDTTAQATAAVSSPPGIAHRSPRKAGNASGCSLEHEWSIESDDDFYHLPVGDEEGSEESRYIEDFYN